MNLTASARLIMQLGEQLIEDELVALLELIKNAYDADANNVDVVIDTCTVTPYGKGRIEIKDINKVWSSMQGVYVYRNGFRVLPYGRKDWIGFTEKSQKAAANIYREHTVVGYLKIDGFTSENLEEQTNRQGFIQDEYGKNFFMLLQEFLLNIIFESDVSFRDGFTSIKNFENRVVTENGVDVLVEGENISIKANKGILTTIFDNIFLNSLYWVRYSEQKKYIRFIVKQSGSIECYDSGCGVHPEIEDKLFEPFRFMKENGRGLGLFIVKELTENMNGRVWLSDERREGRRYKFVFDLSERMV